MALSENEKRRFENRYRGIAGQNSDPFESLPDSVKARLYKRKSTLEKNAGDVPASKRKHIYSEFGTGVETEFRNNLPGLAQEYARKRAERERTLPLIGAGVYEAMTGNNMPSLALEYAQERAAQGYKRPSLKDTDFRNKVLENAFTGLQLSQMAMKGSPSEKDTAAEYMATKDSQSKRKPYTLRNTPYDQDLAVYTPPEVEEKRRREKFKNVGFYDQNDEFVRYDGLERQSDFPEMVKSGKEKDNVFNANYGLIDYLNKDKRDVLKATNTNFTYMTDTEKDLYYYLNAKYGAKAASNYVESISKELNRRSAEYVTNQTQKFGKEHPVLGTVADAAFATVGSGAYPWIVAKTLSGDNDIDPNDPAFAADIMNSGIRAGISENDTLKSIIPNKGVRDFAVGTGLSMSENIGRLPMGYLGLAVAAGGAGLSATREAVERGGSDDQAIAFGAANAVAEAFFEKFSLENLKSLKAAPGKGVRIFLRNIGKQALTEGSEEVFTEIANTVSDQVIMRELSNYNLELEYYKSHGMSEEEAKQKAFGTFLSNVALAGAGGAVSGGLMGGGGQLLGNYELSQYGKSIDQDYREYAQGIDTSRESYTTEEDYQKAVELQQLAEEYAARQANKEMISNRDKAEYEIALENFQNDVIQHMPESESTENAPYQETMEEATAREATVTQNQAEMPQAREITPVAQKPDNVAYNALESNASALEEWAKPFGTEGREAFKTVYDGETDLGAYYRAFGRAYNIGRYNMEPTPQQRAEAAVILGVDGFSEAFKAGAHDRPEIGYDRKTGSLNGMVMGSPKEGGLGTVAQSATEAQKKAATHIGKLTGLQIDLVDGLNNQNAAASYSKGKITLSVYSSDFMGSASHELTHYIKDYAPDAYQVYSDHAVRAITEAQGVDLETMINDYISTYEQQTDQQLSREEAVDEIVADATQKFLNDPDFINRAIKEDSTIGQRIIDFLTDVIDAIKELVKTGSTRRAAKALEENLQYFEQCRQEWMTGLDEAGARYKAGWEVDEKTREKYKIEKPDQITDENINENYDRVRNMKPVAELTGEEFAKGDKDLISQVTDYYNSIGKVHNDVVGDIYLTKESAKDDVAHGVGRLKAITFAAVPEVLKNGYVLDFQKNWKDRKYDTVIIGAPITVSDGKYAGNYYEIAVVKVAEDNKMYVHEVYAQEIKESLPFKTPSFPQSGSRSESAPSSIYSIFGKLLNVNEAVENKDEGNIRFQLEDVDTVDVRVLQQEFQTLREANDLLKKQFELTSKSKPRQEEVKKVVTKYLRKYNSTYNPETFKRNIGGLYEYIRSAEQVDGAEVTELATGIAKSLLKKSRSTSEFADQYQDLKRQIKDTKIKITDQDKADLAQMGGYNTFRRQYFGKLTMGNDGISIDSLYQELSSQHPELFPADITHPADQLMAVAAAVDTMTEQIENPYHANLDEMSYIVGQEILMDYFEVRPEPPTFADRKAAEVQKVRREYTQKMNDFKNGIKQKYNQAVKEVWLQSNSEIEKMRIAYNNMSDAARREYKDYYMDKMNELRNDKNQSLAAMQQRHREQLQQRRESLRAQNAKKGILKERQALETWLLKPTDSKHIPQALRTTVAEFLGNIDFSSVADEGTEGVVTLRTKAWNNARKAFEEIVKTGVAEGEEGKAFYMEVDPDLVNRLEELTNKAQGVKRLDEMDAYSLEELQKTIKSIKKAITEANALKSNRRYKIASDLAEGVIEDLQTKKTKTEYVGPLRFADSMFNYDMLDPQTMFGEMGPHMKSTYDSLRYALDKKTLHLRAAQAYMDQLLENTGISKKDIRQWTGKHAKTIEFDVAGGKISLTIPQIMSIYELDKRPQARNHMYDRNGGIKSAPRTVASKIVGGKVVPGHVEKPTKPTRVSEFDIKKIISSLTPEQKVFADGVQQYLGNEVAKWGNEVTMEMYGYEKFTAGNYFPIVTDKNYIMTKEGDVVNQMSTIKNMGSTKSTIDHAHNPIIIEDIFDVFTRQVDQMSSYNAYVIPLSDFNKVWNYMDMRGKNLGSVKENIEKTFGRGGNDYLKKLIIDINGSINTEKSVADKLLSNMKAASVSGNLRVAIQQPTAYMRAMMEIDPKYLAKGAFTISRKDQWGTILKYAPIAQWKEWGFYRMDVSRQMKDVLFETDSMVQRFTNSLMIGAEFGDKIAWQRLWRACEYECLDVHPELKQGTDEFYKKVGERFSEVVDKTQVADSILHRTQIMRKTGADKFATAFMAEPLKTYNMLYRAAMDVHKNAPGAKARAIRAAAVFTATSFATAVAASVMDALRDDDRDKTLQEKYKESVWDNFWSNMNLINNVPYLRDAWSTFQGFAPVRQDVSAYQDLQYAYKKLEKLYEGDSKLTPQYVLAYSLQMSSKLLGVPIRTISRDAGAIIDTARNIAGGEADYKWLRQKYDIGHDDNRKMYGKMILEAEEAGNTSLADTIRADMVASGADPEKINSSIDGIIKKRYEDDERIQQAAQARIDGRPEEYKRLYEDILADPVYEGQYPEQVQKLIKSAQGKLKEAQKSADYIGDEGEEEEKAEDQGETYTSIYTNADMINALTAGNKEGFALVAEDIYKSKIAAGKTKKESLSSIRQAITAVYKKKYKEAKTREEKDNIIKLMNTLRVAGQNIYSGYDYSSWRK
ncbi:hypothetical protein [Enterocloster lavalensis]|uniref:hypothetical protein n=1 Tax=Enterocloster lavalensis TaxID=460384 RepID=UPI0026658BCA|nr:hypothetical protein [Enterocloster lavalensis]